MKFSKFLFCVVAVILASTSAGFSQKKGNPAFAKIEDDPALPRVLIIGDSISIGYTADARKALKGKANVHRVPTNSGDSEMGIKGLPKWLDAKNGDWDVIHFNWGLWDLCYRHPESKNQGKRDKVKGKVTHSIEEYSANLEKIVTRLEKTGARLIFATTTPVPEGEAGRKVGDDLKYNAAAAAVMKKHGVEIDDLHAVMAGKMDQYGTKPGDVHFKPEGSKLLGEQVAKAIGGALPEVTVLFDGKDFDQWDLDEEGGWVIEDDGAMTCLMKEVERKGVKKMGGRGNLWTKKTYGDFDLTLSYKLSDSSNSGVFYRSDKTDSVQNGFELQLMDNVGFQKKTGPKEDRKLNGSFYDCLAPSSDAQNPIGEWNTLRIICKGPRIRFWINSTQIIDVNVTDWDTPGKNPDGTTNKFKKAVKDFPKNGYIGVQNHGQKVWFRDVKIREL